MVIAHQQMGRLDLETLLLTCASYIYRVHKKHLQFSQQKHGCDMKDRTTFSKFLNAIIDSGFLKIYEKRGQS